MSNPYEMVFATATPRFDLLCIEQANLSRDALFAADRRYTAAHRKFGFDSKQAALANWTHAIMKRRYEENCDYVSDQCAQWFE